MRRGDDVGGRCKRMECTEKNIKLWKYCGFTKAGNYHNERNLLCQDRISYQSNGEVQAIALVDGIGKTDKNIFASERIADYLTDLVVEKYHMIMKGNNRNDIKRKILSDVYFIIEKLMKEYSMPKEEFASTLMVLGINHSGQNYCAIHLGDGIIVGKDSKIRVLSYPENGFCENQTYLTISENALKKMKMLSGDIGDVNEFALITDGGYEIMDLNRSVEQILDQEHFVGIADDDRGFVCLKQ